ncbi:MAG: DUF748 domain-containing protein [Gammaproteobacteria bacterium]
MRPPAFATKISGRKVILWLVGLLVLFSIAGFLATPPLIKKIAADLVYEKFQRRLVISDITLNPYTLTLTASGVSLSEPDGKSPAVTLDEALVNLDITSVLRRSMIIRELKLTGPHIKLIRYEGARYNISDIIAELLKPLESPTRFAISNIQISGGQIDFEDRPKSGRHRVSDVKLALPYISNFPDYADIYVEPAFSARVDDHPVTLAAKSKPFEKTRDSILEVTIKDLHLPEYLEYVPFEIPVKATSATLNTDLKVLFSMKENQPNSIRVSGQAALDGVELKERDGAELFKLARLTFHIADLDIIARQANITKVGFESPELYLSRTKSGSFNLASLLPADTKAASRENNSSEFRYAVDQASITNGTVHFSDLALRQPFHATLQDIEIKAAKLGNRPGQAATLDATLKTDGGESLEHHGDITLAPLSAQGKISLDGLDLLRYAPYYDSASPVAVHEGMLGASSRYSFAQTKNGAALRLTELAMTASALRLGIKNERRDFLTIPALSIEGVDIDFTQHTLSAGAISSRDGRLLISRAKNGSLNLSKLAQGGPQQTKKPERQDAAWQIAVKKAELTGYTLKFDDQAAAGPVTLTASPLNLAIEDFATFPRSRATVSLRTKLRGGGSLAASGPLQFGPFSTKLRLRANGINLVALQPYFTDKVNIILTRGEAAVNGRVNIEPVSGDTHKVLWVGEADISHLHSVDKVNAEDFLEWDSLHVGGINGSYNPFRLDIKEVALSDFYSRVIVNPDGRFNLQNILVKEEKQSQEPPPPAQPSADGENPVRIGAVTLQGGRINFSDRFIKPNYSANLTKFGGRVTGLSSQASILADVDLRSEVDGAAPLEIKGTINPLAKELFLDLQANVKGFELSPLTPYSGKYAGYGIDKGKLSLDIKYHVENRKLEAQNKLLLEQLTFGEKIDSPTATKLPVLLVVALLKDRNGNIDVNLPISGTLDDPDFSIGGIVIKMIVNFVVKVVTSPFALLGSLFGGGEELSYLEFDYGRHAIAPAMENKLNTLAKALNERPALDLDIAGRADPELDKEGLRNYQMEQKVKAAKLRTLVEQGIPAGSAEEITVESQEYPKYLKEAYKREKFPKPRTFIGLLKDLPVPEMEKLMLANTIITDDDLRQLANERANAVKEYLLRTGQVVPQQLFVVASRLQAEEGKDASKDKAKQSRVDFSLK